MKGRSPPCAYSRNVAHAGLVLSDGVSDQRQQRTLVSRLKADVRPVGAWFVLNGEELATQLSPTEVDEWTTVTPTGQAKVEKVRSIVALAADSLT